MARHALVRSLAIAAAIVCACTTGVRAQSLQRLTVTQLTLSDDTASPHIEVPFHLIVTAHVREQITELDNVDLPILAELELLGDEHSITAGAGGTTYRETITVIAHHGGEITIAPVTLDAIDARDGRAKRYSSNALTLHVLGPLAMVTPAAAPQIQWGPIVVAVAIAIGIWIAIVVRRRRPARRPVPAMTLAPPVPVTTRDPRERVRTWLAELRANPTRAGAMLVRAQVRRSVGASETETLIDVLRRPLAQDAATAHLLRGLERAGFTYESDLAAAIAAALAQLEEMAR